MTLEEINDLLTTSYPGMLEVIDSNGTNEDKLRAVFKFMGTLNSLAKNLNPQGITMIDDMMDKINGN